MKKENEEKNIQSKEVKKANNKKVSKFIIILVIAILIVLSAFLYNKSNSKVRKAKEAFGTGYCDAILHMSTMDLAKHKCKICGTEFEDSSMHADICSKCAEETQRCEFCGKNITNEIKEQRRNRLQKNRYEEN